MIRTNTAAHPYEMPGFPGTVFMLRAGDVIERGELEADLAELRAGRVFDWQLQEAFMAGVTALLPNDPEDVERIREVSAAEQEGAALTRDDQSLLEGARDAVQQHWPDYRRLVSQKARRDELVTTLAFQRFCTGWEGKDLPEFKTGLDGRVTAEAVGKLPPIMLRLAGIRAYRLLYTTEDLGNSAPPLQSDKSRRRSSSDKRKAGGRSARASGR